MSSSQSFRVPRTSPNSYDPTFLFFKQRSNLFFLRRLPVLPGERNAAEAGGRVDVEGGQIAGDVLGTRRLYELFSELPCAAHVVEQF